jgi:thiol:disulfide interchange protein DsbD
MRFLLTTLALFLVIPYALAQGGRGSFAEVAEITARFDPPAAKPGAPVKLLITVTPKPGCWTYPVAPPDGQAAVNIIKPPPSPPIRFSDTFADPPGAKTKFDKDAGENVQYYSDAATWELTGIVANGPPGKKTLSWTGTRIQACNKSNCFPASNSDYPPLEFEVLPGEAVPTPPTVKPDLPQPTPVTPTAPKKEEVPAGLVKKKPIPVSEHEAKLNTLLASLEKQEVKREGGLLALLLTAAFWGLVSLATPCVFPMIPITVSLFLKQSNQSAGGAAKLAGVYCGTIIAVLGISAIFLLSVFRALSVNPWMNLALGVLFVVFALSLFGMFDIRLPNFLLQGAEAKRKQGGLIGTVFGAIAFSIVSFTCVAPFLGGFAGMASSGQYTQFELVLAGLAFAAAFAAPFFVLALFPSLLKKLPKSGGWLDSVKVVMGFLEIAAALKFFRTAELRWLPIPQYFTYDLVLAAWVVISIACGIYLLGLFRLPHDEEKSSIGVMRLMFALLFLGLGFYLLPGVFKAKEGEAQRPNGVVFAWVDAFLLPEPSATGSGGEELPWGSDLPDALKRAYQESQRTGQPKYVFADFTGVTCTNCKANERSVFTLANVKDEMRKYELTQMYTDDVPAAFFDGSISTAQREAEARANLKFQKEAFGTEQLPLYVIFQPTKDGAKVVNVYDEGKINNVPAFLEFLKKPYEKK